LNEAPYQASIFKSGQHRCGASIIRRDFVVTAAHCVQSRVASDFQVRVGTVYKGTGGEIFEVSKIIFHPSNNRRTNLMDIALIKLKGNITLESGEKEIIKMVNQDEVIGDETLALVSGWGSTRNANESNIMLRGVIVPIISFEKCKKSYYDISDEVICAGYLGIGGKDSCQGKNDLINILIVTSMNFFF
jgi:trypsin